MKSNGNKNKENNSSNTNYNRERSPRMLSLKHQHKNSRACAMELDEASSCSSSVSSASSKVPSRFQPSRSPNNPSFAGLPVNTPYLGPSLSPVSSPQWRLTAGASSPGATASGRAVPKSALIMSRILNSRSTGIPNMEPVHADAKDMLEKTISDGRTLAEQSANHKVIDLPYQQSPKHSPSLVPLILQTEDVKDDELLIEIKTTDCIFNFEDIFEDEIEKETVNENIDECNRGKRVDLNLTESVINEEPDVFIEGKNTNNKPEGIIKEEKEEKLKENEVQGGSDIAINVPEKKRNSNEEIKGKSSTVKKNRREKGRKSKEGRVKEGKTKEEGLKDNKVKDEFLNKLEKEVDVLVDFAFTAKDLTAQVERIIFTSISGILKVLISKLVVIFRKMFT
ncbi:unnamed protein product [Meloidogyne enterolobii]|uniref:Uncharacterized protein n=1 Tax=Meloidogyne enterolobii TaxID=390850 RepID=A0ACB1AKK9_MELEN